jgi:hypothetical protein
LKESAGLLLVDFDWIWSLEAGEGSSKESQISEYLLRSPDLPYSSNLEKEEPLLVLI